MQHGRYVASTLRYRYVSLQGSYITRFMDQYSELDEGALDGEEIGGALTEGDDRMEQLIKAGDKKNYLITKQ